MSRLFHPLTASAQNASLVDSDRRDDVSPHCLTPKPSPNETVSSSGTAAAPNASRRRFAAVLKPSAVRRLP